MDQVRQGDVLLVPVKTAIGKAIRRKGRKSILAYGEVTGHHHRFETDAVQMFRHDDGGGSARVFVKIKEPSGLVHEEHSKITLPAGKFEQAFQTEYTPKELRRVAD